MQVCHSRCPPSASALLVLVAQHSNTCLLRLTGRVKVDISYALGDRSSLRIDVSYANAGSGEG